MKKTISIFAILLIMLLGFSGCTKTKSYTYEVETGDVVEIKIDATDGYDLTAKTPFKIKKDDEVLSQGIFLTMDGYEQYMAALEDDYNVKILDKGTKNGLEYVLYSYKDEEYNYIIKIKDSDTGILLGNNVSEKSAKECFKRLTIKAE